MTNKKPRGRPRIMTNTKRIIVQLESCDYTMLQDTLTISVSEFFREAVRAHLLQLSP